VANRGGFHGVQLAREQSGASGATDEVNVGAAGTNWTGTSVRLVLEVDPATKVAEAFYAVGTGALTRVGQLTLSEAKFFDGSLVAAGPRANGIGGYAGVYASRRFNTTTTPVRFAFDAVRVDQAGTTANRAPVISPLADRTTDEDAAVDFPVQASDPDGDTMTYSAGTTLPAGISINPTTGRISGVPDSDVARGVPYPVEVTVTDSGGAASTETFAWTITDPPPPPALDALQVNFQNAAAGVPAGNVRDFGLPFGERSLADQGATNRAGLRYGWVRVTEEGRTVSRFPLDLSNPGNGRERNLLTDQRLDTLMHMQGDDVQAFEAAKSPPGTFTGTGVEGAWELAIANGVYDVRVAAGDPMGVTTANAPEKHALRVEGRPAWTGQFIPPNEAGLGRTRTALVSGVTVNDGRLTLDAIGGVNTKVLFLELTRASTNGAPVIDAIADQTSRAGATVDLPVTGRDPEGGALTWSQTGLPPGLSIATSTGTISGTIGATAARTEPYTVTVTATDAGSPALSSSRTFAWTVREDVPPTVDTVTPASGATGVALAGDVTATFSEPVTGVSATTFTLSQGTTAIPATVTYDAATRTATLDPGSTLAANTVYTATVKGGTDGVRDLADNALAQSRTWSFTHARGRGEHAERHADERRVRRRHDGPVHVAHGDAAQRGRGGRAVDPGHGRRADGRRRGAVRRRRGDGVHARPGRHAGGRGDLRAHDDGGEGHDAAGRPRRDEHAARRRPERQRRRPADLRAGRHAGEPRRAGPDGRRRDVGRVLERDGMREHGVVRGCAVRGGGGGGRDEPGGAGERGDLPVGLDRVGGGRGARDRARRDGAERRVPRPAALRRHDVDGGRAAGLRREPRPGRDRAGEPRRAGRGRDAGPGARARGAGDPDRRQARHRPVRAGRSAVPERVRGHPADDDPAGRHDAADGVDHRRAGGGLLHDRDDRVADVHEHRAGHVLVPAGRWDGGHELRVAQGVQRAVGRRAHLRGAGDRRGRERLGAGDAHVDGHGGDAAGGHDGADGVDHGWSGGGVVDDGDGRVVLVLELGAGHVLVPAGRRERRTRAAPRRRPTPASRSASTLSRCARRTRRGTCRRRSRGRGR
jgi:hypothetical protein